uniref:DAN domain family, member 5 n=1 Tax=Takifugu rubripes TaxID=31033 RepID=H2SM98_TAKRU
MKLFPLTFVFMSSMTALAFTLPHSAFDFLKGPKAELESSGSGPNEPVQGVVRVFPLDPRSLAHSGFLRRGPSARRGPSLSPRMPFPAFLSQGRPGPAPASKALVSPLHHLQPKSETEVKKKQGLQMWQKAVSKGDLMPVSLPASLKEGKQSCSGVPFTQRVTAAGCSAVTVHNKLCFGQCSSLFVPSEAPLGTGMGLLHHRGPCSRCAPSKAHAVVLPLLCGARVQEKRVLVVEECKCETGREEKAAQNAASGRL